MINQSIKSKVFDITVILQLQLQSHTVSNGLSPKYNENSVDKFWNILSDKLLRLQFDKFNVFNLFACTNALFGATTCLLPAKINVDNALALENSMPCSGFNALLVKSM